MLGCMGESVLLWCQRRTKKTCDYAAASKALPYAIFSSVTRYLLAEWVGHIELFLGSAHTLVFFEEKIRRAFLRSHMSRFCCRCFAEQTIGYRSYQRILFTQKRSVCQVATSQNAT